MFIKTEEIHWYSLTGKIKYFRGVMHIHWRHHKEKYAFFSFTLSTINKTTWRSETLAGLWKARISFWCIMKRVFLSEWVIFLSFCKSYFSAFLSAHHWCYFNAHHAADEPSNSCWVISGAWRSPLVVSQHWEWCQAGFPEGRARVWDRRRQQQDSEHRR